MAKIGRNQPCPCGSGKKYKHCCAEKDRGARIDVVPAMPSQHGHFFIDELDQLSNSVIDLVNEGRLDEADAVCERLRSEYPEVNDWLMRKAMVCEARAEYEQAITYCQRVIDWMDAHPEDFDPHSRDSFHADIARLKNLADEAH